MSVPSSTPKASETAMGTKMLIEIVLSSMIGSRPANVVMLVSTIGRKRTLPEWLTAHARSAPSRRCRLM